MHLLHSPASPFVRKVRVLLRETGQTDVEERAVATTPMDTAAEVAAANPLGKIPALVRDDGPALYDSRVICRFLDHRAGARLYPEGALWEVLTLEATGDAIMEAAVGMTYEKRFRGERGLVWDEWLDRQWAKATRALDAVEARSMPLLEGPLNMGQVAIGCALGYLDFRHGDRDWRAGRDTLSAWERRFADRPSMRDTRPG